MTADLLPDLTGVPALTLHQPWAHAIAYLGKSTENRGWAPWRRVTRILIHAGKDDDPDGWATIRTFGFDIARDDVPQSAIVAVTNLTGVCDAAMRGGRCGCGRWAAAGQYHWKLGAVWTLAHPVPCRGWQGLWKPTPDLLRQVQAAGILHRDGDAA